MSKVWECNECGSQQYTTCVSEVDVQNLGCSACGGDEWHLAEERKAQPKVDHIADASKMVAQVHEATGVELVRHTVDSLSKIGSTRLLTLKKTTKYMRKDGL